MPLKLYKEDKKDSTRVVAIAAGKGGVGKSTVTINLARALHSMGFSVGVMDADIYGPSIRKMLPEDTLPQQMGRRFIPANSSGIRIISMAYFRKEHEAAAIRAPIANGIIGQFIKDVDWGPLDYLLIDFPPGTGDVQLTLSQQANLTGAIMVTTPQEVAVMDVRKAINLFEQVRVPIIGIVENMSYYLPPGTQERHYLFGQGGGARLAGEAGVPLLGEIPIDPAICRSGDLGRSLFENDLIEARYAAKQFLNLAETMNLHLKRLNPLLDNSLQEFELVWKDM